MRWRKQRGKKRKEARCHRAALPDRAAFIPTAFAPGGRIRRSPALLTTTPKSRARAITGITPNCLRIGEGDYRAFGSILPLSCLAAGARRRLGLCLSIRLQRGGRLSHTLTCTHARTHAHPHTPLQDKEICLTTTFCQRKHSRRNGCDYGP